MSRRLASLIDAERVAAALEFQRLGDALVALLALNDALAIPDGTVWFFSAARTSIGPRSGSSC